LSQAYSWRATFVLLCVLLVPIFLLALYAMPETHHYFVLKKIVKSNAAHAQTQNPQAAVEAGNEGGMELTTAGNVERNVAITDNNTAVVNTASAGDGDIEAPAASGTNTGAGKGTGIGGGYTSIPADNHLQNDLTTGALEHAPPSAPQPRVQEDVILHHNLQQHIIHVHEAKDIYRPTMLPPWTTLYRFLLDSQLAPSYFLMCTHFGT
jgi:hypothetical protein